MTIEGGGEHLAGQPEKEPTPQEIFNEQLHQAGSVNAQVTYAYEQQWSKISEEYLRDQGFDIEGKLAEYDWRPTLLAARDNLKKLSVDEGGKGELTDRLALVEAEIVESN